jgi:hypothetical protein
MTTHKAAKRRVHVVRTLAMGLWLPALFLCGFAFVYLSAFHQPSPHGVTVAVVARPRVLEQLQQHLDATVPGGFRLQPAFDAHQAQAAVLGREAVAGYVPDARHPALYLARAAGPALEPVIQQAFTALSDATGGPLITHELAPTAPGDGTGTSMLYLVLACTLPPYFVVVSMQRAVGFGRWAHVITMASVGAFISAVCYLSAAYIFHVLPQHPLTMLYFFLLTQVISLTTYGLAPFLKQFFPAVVVTMFVYLGVPSSGASLPLDLVPGFYRALHPFAPLGQATDAIRGVDYFDDRKLLVPTGVLCAWIAFGALLIVLGYVKHLRALAREAAGAAEFVEEPAPEDPTVQAPAPVALDPHRQAFGQEEAMLHGKVTDMFGEPLPGAVITVTTPHGRQLVRTRTDEAGEYAVTGFDDGFVIVVASALDRQAAVARCYVSVEAPAMRQDFVLGLLPTGNRAN